MALASERAVPSWVLGVTAFVAGFGVMGAEMAAGRLLAPYYGTSTLVWSLLIASVLSAWALGSHLGGRFSARERSFRGAFVALAAAGVVLATFPAVARPLLRSGADEFFHGSARVLVTSGLVVALLLMAPVALLGAIGPVLVERGVKEQPQAGAVAGRLGALGTLGSLLGTLVPGLVLVPWLGTDRCFRLCGALLVAVGALGLWRSRWAIGAALALVVSGAAWSHRPPPRTGTIYEAESRFGYLRVTESKKLRRFYLNEGYAVQSIARLDGEPYLRDVWGYYALAPSVTRRGRPESVLVVGLGGGSSARQYVEAYPSARVRAVELDPAVVDVARRYFGLPSSVDVAIGDGRSFLAGDSGRYDLIVVDAFQFPYVPFQLATAEFFALAHAHLRPGGAFVINVGRNREHHEVVDAVAATLARSFRHVGGVDVPGTANTILVGTEHELAQGAGVRALGLPAAQVSALELLRPLEPWPIVNASAVLTDDRAPIEALTDQIVLHELWKLLRGG